MAMLKLGGLRCGLVAMLLAVVSASGFAAAPAAGPYLDDLTWTELRDRIQAGSTTILVPIGGTEQNGPHMVLGKHNVRARLLAAQIAAKLGNAVVAPVLAYVTEGAVNPPTAHMRFTGTITMPDATFEAVLESTARSFCQHGFRDVVFLGDHGGYQKSEERAAARVNVDKATPAGCKVHALTEYYRVTQAAYIDDLKARGMRPDEIGTHAGLADTALTLAIDPALVRQDVLARMTPRPQDGVYGDPRRATAEAGQAGVDAIIETSVAEIRAFTQAR